MDKEKRRKYQKEYYQKNKERLQLKHRVYSRNWKAKQIEGIKKSIVSDLEATRELFNMNKLTEGNITMLIRRYSNY